MTARWVDTTLTIDVDHWDDATVDTALLPDGDVRLTIDSTPPIVVTMPRECAEVLEDRIRRARLKKPCDYPECVLPYGHVESCAVA